MSDSPQPQVMAASGAVKLSPPSKSQVNPSG